MKIQNWKAKTKGISINKTKDGIKIVNNLDKEAILYSYKVIKCRNNYVNINFKGKVIEGSGVLFKLINRHKSSIVETVFNSETSSTQSIKGLLLPILVIKPHTIIEIENAEITKTNNPENTYNKFMGKKKILLITPSYPSPDNLYACAFVHSRVKEYIKENLDIEVACVNSYNSMSHYTIEGIEVYKTNYSELRSILMGRKYNAILVHFLDEMYAYYLTTSYIKDTPIILWNHGADILYWDYKKIYTPYFTDEYTLPKETLEKYKKRDEYIKELANNDNVHWVFVSNSEKNDAEKMHNIKFKNSVVIPNIINSELFSYSQKDDPLRKNIFLLRRFDNTRKYAIDIAVLTILELSRREIFKDLNFYICGEGEVHDKLVEPIRKFPNVHIINNFLSHDQIKEYHDKCGIALFPTRQDTQGVSALEAASSGLVVITSDLEVIREYFDESLNTICPTEDYTAYADVIERLYNNPKEFQKISKKMSLYTNKICNKGNTIDKEIEYINDNIIDAKQIISKIKEISDNPILTVVIPSYNAEKYLNKCVPSLLKSKYSYMTEILIINDGSKDNTSKIGKYYQELTTINNKSIVKLIDKENGGHGSGINKGIELAKGKYFKVIDADDWVDENDYDKLLENLINEDADLILTDYMEARSFEDKPYVVEYFKNLTPNIIYNLDDVCTGFYGFKDWGPTLPTSTYKTEVLRKTNFKLFEKTFYVDMLYNAYSIININTIKRYDLNIYRYYIGNAGQSVSAEGMKRNYKDHENVIIELMNIVTNDNRFTENKRNYVLNKLLLPMVNTQYYIIMDMLHSRSKFMVFEKRIQQFPNLIKYEEFNKKAVKFHRYTFGIFISMTPFLRKFAYKVRRIIQKIKNLIKRVLRKMKRIIIKIIK